MTQHSIKICPSILASDLLRLKSEVEAIEKAGADMVHVDVMDGHFVPNLTFGLCVVEALRKSTHIPLDVHLMITNPDAMALNYVTAGAQRVSFHVEAATHAHRLASAIRAQNAKVGIAINPGSALELLWPLLEEIDFINVMSVNPGFSGQKFISATIGRIDAIRDKLMAKGLNDKVSIEVDGGITEQTAPLVKAVGATELVAGNSFFKAQDQYMLVKNLRAQ